MDNWLNSHTYILVFLFFLNTHNVAFSCSRDIAKKTCKVDQYYPESSHYSDIILHLQRLQDPTCAEDSNKYGEILKDLYKKLPNHSTEAFCVIKKIIILPEEAPFAGSAGRYFDLKAGGYSISVGYESYDSTLNTKVLGYVLSLNVKLFKAYETEEESLSRMMSVPFEGREDFKNNLNEFPEVEMNKEPYKYSSLLKTVTHEIGHFLDFSNGVTANTSVSGEFEKLVKYNYLTEEYPLLLTGDSFAFYKNNWFLGLYDRRVKNLDIEINGYFYSNVSWSPYASDILTTPYWPVSKHRLEEVYSELQKSNFISFYSLSNPTEDFAETYLHYVDTSNFTVVKDGMVLLDESLKYKEPAFNSKVEIVKKIMSFGFKNEIGTPFQKSVKLR